MAFIFQISSSRSASPLCGIEGDNRSLWKDDLFADAEGAGILQDV
jgi:hypothetical protein